MVKSEGGRGVSGVAAAVRRLIHEALAQKGGTGWRSEESSSGVISRRRGRARQGNTRHHGAHTLHCKMGRRQWGADEQTECTDNTRGVHDDRQDKVRAGRRLMRGARRRPASLLAAAIRRARSAQAARGRAGEDARRRTCQQERWNILPAFALLCHAAALALRWPTTKSLRLMRPSPAGWQAIPWTLVRASRPGSQGVCCHWPADGFCGHAIGGGAGATSCPAIEWISVTAGPCAA